MKKPVTDRHRCLSLRESHATFAERKATLCRQSPANCQRPVNGYGEGLTWANTRYESIQGKIVSNWKREGDKLSMEVTIPANTVATVHVPAKEATGVTEGGNTIDKSKGVKFLRMGNNTAHKWEVMIFTRGHVKITQVRSLFLVAGDTEPMK